MTRTRPPRPDLVRILRDIARRVAILERADTKGISPISATAATVNSTSAQTPYMALINPTGASMTWWVQVTPVSGTTTSLQLRASDGAVGDIVTAPTSGTNIVSVTLAVPPSWQPGVLIMVYLDAWISANSATVVPVRAMLN